MNVYLEEVHQNLPRILSQFDMDPVSESYGYGDRFHWAWSIIDFASGKYQGVAHGLARLVRNGLLPEGVSERSILNRIDAMFIGAERLRRPDGSLEEAFPYEASFALTSIVALDLLTAIELLSGRVDAGRTADYLAVVRPMIGFLRASDEKHGFISNHLAWTSAALIKWSALSGETGQERGVELLDRILDRQSPEGWYLEYQGADPGYQSLCTFYLAEIYRMRPDDRLLHSLRQSMRFLWHFAHPDGSFGGIYGSRNTRFYYPSGIESLAGDIPEAASLAKFMRASINRQTVVTLSAIDPPNLVSMFNSYCWAAELAQRSDVETCMELPCRTEPFRTYWKDAGILVDRGETHYSVIASCKGGVVYHFEDDHLSRIDVGLVFRSPTGRRFSTQSYNSENEVEVTDDKVVIRAEIQAVSRRLPKPWQFIVLRALNLTLMRFMWVREMIKRMIVKMLISGRSSRQGVNTRSVTLGSGLTISDSTQLAAELQRMDIEQPFTAIHMASEGYWQIQDDSKSGMAHANDK